jgi:acetyl-CoA carboxylase biotin carboxyl carrier protein
VSLTAADVAEIMRLVEESSFDELILEVDGIKLTLKRGAGVEGATTQSVTQGAASPTASASEPVQAVSAPTSASPTSTRTNADPNVQDVVSPLLGTFYRAPKPGAPPFVEVGSTVEEDTVVAIIEVMKLMNTVRAGVRGTVTEILARDGVLVEYGEVLLRVRKQ